jgi:thiamine-monophosphate kinase
MVSKASKVGFLIENPPVADEIRKFAENHGLDPVELCLYGGEEYELVVTVKPKLWEKAKKAASLIKIGLVTKERNLLLEEKGKRIHIEPRGWEHFKSNICLL